MEELEGETGLWVLSKSHYPCVSPGLCPKCQPLTRHLLYVEVSRNLRFTMLKKKISSQSAHCPKLLPTNFPKGTSSEKTLSCSRFFSLLQWLSQSFIPGPWASSSLTLFPSFIFSIASTRTYSSRALHQACVFVRASNTSPWLQLGPPPCYQITKNYSIPPLLRIHQ